jgi:hypothetical protein
MIRWLGLVAVSLFALGCSEDKGDGGGQSGLLDYTNNGAGVCSGTTRPANDAFCQNTCVGEPNCKNTQGRPVDSCCVPVGEPGREVGKELLTRTTNTKEFSDPTGAPPDVSCFDEGSYPPAPPAGGQSQTATLTGLLKVFANGGCTEDAMINTPDHGGVIVEVWTVKRTPGNPDTDGQLDQLVGTALEANDTMLPAELETVDNKCPDDERYNLKYTYPNVPMYTELVVKTTGDGWAPLYAYNVYISEADPMYDAANNTYEQDVRALAGDDFTTIPTAAIGKTITSGNGAIGGEVHDCGNIRLQNATVDISLPRAGLKYFDDNEDNPLPNTSRLGTGKTALYTGLDIKVSGAEGSFVRMAASGLVPDGDGAKLVSLGYFDARIFPDSVTSVTLRGLRPFQVPGN